MKRLVRFFGIIALGAVIGVSITACGDARDQTSPKDDGGAEEQASPGDSGGGGGGLTADIDPTLGGTAWKDEKTNGAMLMILFTPRNITWDGLGGSSLAHAAAANPGLVWIAKDGDISYKHYR